MWQEEASELLRKEIETLLSPLESAVGLLDVVKEALAKLERGSSAKGNSPWPLIPLVVSDAISGHYEQALPAAAAIQFFRAAAEVFDDIEDADSPGSLVSKYGLATTTNAATTLTILAEKAISWLKERGVAGDSIVHVLDVVNSYYITACAGQHLDLLIRPGVAMSEETYIRIATMKSASQVECAFHVGALLAEAQPQLICLFSDFGNNLGLAAQIANDIRGIMDGNDIRRRKITLPVIYALAQAEGETRTQLEAVFCGQSGTAPDCVQIRHLLFTTGAVHYSTLKVELYKQYALDALSRAEEAGTRVERLKLFLE